MKVIAALYFFLTLPGSISAQPSSEIDSLGITKDSSISLIWQKEIDSRVSIPLLVSGEKIFITAHNGNIFCFDLNGNLIWSYETGGTLISRPAVDNNVLAAGTIEGDLFSIDAVSGEVLQVLGLGEAVTSDLIIIDILKNGSKSKGVVLGTEKGNLYCYDLYTFELIWKNNSAGESILGKLLLIKNRIIFGSRDKYLYCIDAKAGVINWKWKNSKLKEAQEQNVNLNTCIPASDEKLVYIIGPQNKILSAIDLLLGTSVWQKKDFKVSNSIGISQDGKKIFLPGAPGNFYIISAAEGKLIKEIKMESGSEKSCTEPVEWNNNILSGSSSGKIYLIDSQFKWKTIISLDESIISVNSIRANIFTALSSSGRIIVFKIY